MKKIMISVLIVVTISSLIVMRKPHDDKTIAPSEPEPVAVTTNNVMEVSITDITLK